MNTRYLVASALAVAIVAPVALSAQKPVPAPTGMIAVIQTFVYPNAYNEHLVWGAILFLLLTRGPGVLSLDYLIARSVSHL